MAAAEFVAVLVEAVEVEAVVVVVAGSRKWALEGNQVAVPLVF